MLKMNTEMKKIKEGYEEKQEIGKKRKKKVTEKEKRRHEEEN